MEKIGSCEHMWWDTSDCLRSFTFASVRVCGLAHCIVWLSSLIFFSRRRMSKPYLSDQSPVGPDSKTIKWYGLDVSGLRRKHQSQHMRSRLRHQASPGDCRKWRRALTAMICYCLRVPQEFSISLLTLQSTYNYCRICMDCYEHTYISHHLPSAHHLPSPPPFIQNTPERTPFFWSMNVFTFISYHSMFVWIFFALLPAHPPSVQPKLCGKAKCGTLIHAGLRVATWSS
jgi:hypothetical protein